MLQKIKCRIFLFALSVGIVGCNNALEQQQLLDDGFVSTPIVSVQEKNADVLAAGPLNDSRTWEFLTVMPSKLECEGYQISNCLLVMDSDGDEITYFYDLIEGFDYEWGYEYKLLVHVSDTNAALIDAPSVRYKLIKEVTKSDFLAGKTFDYIAHHAHKGLERKTLSEYSMIDGELFQCEQSACDSIDQLLEQQMSIILTLQHGPTPDALKTLVSVECADSGVSFTTNCLSGKEVYRHD